MLQAAVSMTFSVHSFHNSDVEVYPVHPRVVQTTFRDRAASVATEFRVRVNSVTAMKNPNGVLEGNVKVPRYLPSKSRGCEPRGRSQSLKYGNLRTKDLRKMSVDEVEEEGCASSSASTANASPKSQRKLSKEEKTANFYIDVSDDELSEGQCPSRGQSESMDKNDNEKNNNDENNRNSNDEVNQNNNGENNRNNTENNNRNSNEDDHNMDDAEDVDGEDD